MIKSIILAGLLSVGYTPIQQKTFKSNVWSACMRDNGNDTPGCLVVTQAIVKCVGWMTDEGHIDKYPVTMNDIWGMKEGKEKDLYFQCIDRTLKEMKYKG